MIINNDKYHNYKPLSLVRHQLLRCRVCTCCFNAKSISKIIFYCQVMQKHQTCYRVNKYTQFNAHCPSVLTKPVQLMILSCFLFSLLLHSIFVRCSWTQQYFFIISPPQTSNTSSLRMQYQTSSRQIILKSMTRVYVKQADPNSKPK